ncbi:hypothetical protein [Dictyobacter kobayashii]|uniref:DUF4064 domain-containing protein n=1 Tax=Dictyobacter kobayashii TaxID=2014872 RepID=A0A402AWS6_9CHLR|nr:hypothetical protein [Dictyobacter kobayashii]GCE23504.1 hypothetical protein KDK_73040 [Dictyobacter kobayashii]
MSKKKRRAQYSQRMLSQRMASQGTTFLSWGIFALVGSAFLFIIGVLFIYFAYKPAHPQVQLSLPLMLTLLSGPLIIEALLVIVGIIAIIIGLRKKRQI